MRVRFVTAAASLVAAAVLLPIRPAAAAGPGGASIQLDRASVRVGQRLLVTVSGFRSRNVTIAVCGNLAERGTVDCNLVAGQALKLLTDPTVTELTVFAPPTTCPCIIRAASTQQDEVAVAPLDIVGVATGPVVGPAGAELIAISARAHATHGGVVSMLRSGLGGPTSYVVEVTLRNLTQQRLTGLAISATVKNGVNASVTSFDVAPPKALAPGTTWVQRNQVRVPAPALGRFSWQVTVSGAGAPTSTTLVSRHVPFLFALVVAIFVADVLVIAGRYVVSRLRRRAGRDEPAEPAGIGLLADG